MDTHFPALCSPFNDSRLNVVDDIGNCLVAELEAVDAIDHIRYVPVACALGIKRQHLLFKCADVVRAFLDEFRLVFAFTVARYIKLDFAHV